jgi:hypothetical protein
VVTNKNRATLSIFGSKREQPGVGSGRTSVLVSALVGILALSMFSLMHAERGTMNTVSGSAVSVAVRMPVLVELFTSEGCSSCPPADTLLEKLDRSQPVATADLVVLSEHVDYWDDIGWKDLYSSRAFSIRQSDYACRFRIEGAYTPQMVVDGQAQIVGSDERGVIQAIQGAAKAAKLPVSLSGLRLEGNAVVAHIESGVLPASASSKSAQVIVALADDNDQSSVKHGENAGRTLTHVAVVRNLAEVGTIDRGGAFFREVKVSTENANPRKLRVVAFVQETGTGKVLGIGSARLPD